MNEVYNLYQFIYEVIVGRARNVPYLEMNINLMHIFGWILSIDDDVIHICCNEIISFILIIFENQKIFICS